MIVVIASVHHTGTNFVWQNLFEGWFQHSMEYEGLSGDLPSGDGLCRIHCDVGQRDYLPWWLENFPAVVPMRHPIRVAESWKARGEDLAPLPAQWEVLKTVVAPHDPSYLPIDSLLRDYWLDLLNKKHGLDLQTDWPVVMSCNKGATLTHEEREAVVEVMADRFFDRFGYEV